MKTGDVKDDKQNSDSGVSREEFYKLQSQLESLQKMGANKDVLMTPGKAENISEGELLKQLVEGLKGKSDLEKYGDGFQYVDESDIDPKDVLEVPVTFFCHKVGYVIVDDMRNGNPVRTPFGRPIVFQYHSTEKKQAGKHVELHSLSMYVCKSKKELEWLRSHRQYGFMFFDKIKSALGADMKHATILARHMMQASNLSPHRVIEIAKSMNIPMSDDVDHLRALVAEKQAKEEITLTEKAHKDRTFESLKEQKILADAQ